MHKLPATYVTDTQAIVLWIEGRKLPAIVSSIFKACTDSNQNVTIWIPAMVLAEIGYLFEKSRIDTSVLHIEKILSPDDHTSGFKMASLTDVIIRKSFEILDIPELHDRLIAGTAFALNCPLLTNDPKIENSAFVDTIWNYNL